MTCTHQMLRFERLTGTGPLGYCMPACASLFPFPGLSGRDTSSDIAQWIEQQTHNLSVAGSNPAIR
jgi:hypothetical protein